MIDIDNVLRITQEGEQQRGVRFNKSGNPIYRYVFQNNIYDLVCPVGRQPLAFHVACCYDQTTENSGNGGKTEGSYDAESET